MRVFTFLSPFEAMIYIDMDLYPTVSYDDIRILIETDTHTIINETMSTDDDEDFYVALEDDFGYNADVPSSNSDTILSVDETITQDSSGHDISESSIPDTLHDPLPTQMSEYNMSDRSLIDALHAPLQTQEHQEPLFDSPFEFTFPELTEATYFDIHKHLFNEKSDFVKLLIRKVIRREIPETLYTEIYQSLRKSGIETGLPSIKRLKAEIKRLVDPIFRHIEDKISIPKIRGGSLSCIMKYRWYTLHQFPIPRLITDYFTELSHISPFQRLEESTEPTSFAIYKDALSIIRTRIGITETMLQSFPSFRDIDEYLDYCEASSLPPIIICPIIAFVDGVATARLGRSALSFVISLANIPANIRQRSHPWQNVCLVSEKNSLISTISVLNTFIQDIKKLQTGVSVTLFPSRRKIILLGFLFRISGVLLNPQTDSVPLFYHSLYSEDALIIKDPFRNHAGDILHILHIGLTNDMSKLLDRILSTSQKETFNARMELLGLNWDVDFVMEMIRSPPQRSHSFSYLYDEDDMFADTEEIRERIVLSSSSLRVTSLDDVINIRYCHIVLMTAILNQFGYDAQHAATDAECDALIEHHNRFLQVLSPLCVKAEIFSSSTPIRKIKTHLLSHIKEWVRDGGPLYNYSAEAGERINSSIYRLYRYIRNQHKCHCNDRYGSRYFANFVGQFEQYRARNGRARLFTLIDLDTLPLYCDVSGAVLTVPPSDPDEAEEKEIAAQEETFLKKVESHFGSLSGLDALYRFDKLELKFVSEKDVAKYVKAFRKTLRRVSDEEKPSDSLLKKYFLDGIKNPDFKIRCEAALDGSENPSLSEL
ncbi:hypothetical protein ADUPG1_009604, partial [Aduncisulcus paluster]